MTQILSKYPLVLALNSNLLEERWDPSFFQPQYLEAYQKVMNTRWNLKKLKDLSKIITQGPNPKKWARDGVPCLKTKNLYSEGWVLDNIDHVPAEEYNRLKRYTLEKNDVMVAIVGFGSTGKANVFKETRPYIFSRALGLIRLKDGEISPDFLAAFLNTESAQLLLNRGATGSTGQLIITTEYLKNLMIPIPPNGVQEAVVKEMSKAYSRRKAMLNKIKELKRILRDYPLHELGIRLQTSTNNLTFTTTSLNLEDRLDADYYHPERIETIRALMQGHFPVKKLRDLSITRNERIDPSQHPNTSFKYVSLGHIEKAGIKVEFSEINGKELLSQKCVFRAGDIIFPKMRTYLNKVALIPPSIQEGICSTEFLVLVPQNVNDVYLWLILTSDVVLKQVSHMQTGSTRPRVTRADIENLKIPVSPNEIQEKIAKKAEEIIKEIKKLRVDADLPVRIAREKVEKLVLRSN